MAVTELSTRSANHVLISRILQAINRVILGKDMQIRLALTCLLAKGHLLIEDFPGVGKTTLAHTLAQVLGLQFQRIQFTSDLLPTDVLGVSVYDQTSGRFVFHPGPVFCQLVLADEINRATPKTQSALLEAMEEHQVTTEGETHALPAPFFVIATQNPGHQIGTFPLPESQLDRFLMRIRLGYPDAVSERELLQGQDRRSMINQQPPATDPCAFGKLQDEAGRVHVSTALLDYLQAILAYTRRPGVYRIGLSPRAGVSLVRSAQAWAYIHDHEFVLPEHLQAVFHTVAGHRLHASEGLIDSNELTRDLLNQVAIP